MWGRPGEVSVLDCFWGQGISEKEAVPYSDASLAVTWYAGYCWEGVSGPRVLLAAEWRFSEIFGCGINLFNQTNPFKVSAVVDDKLSRRGLLCWVRVPKPKPIPCCNSCCKNVSFSPTCVGHVGEEFWIGLRHGCLSHRALAFDMSNCKMHLSLCCLRVDASIQLITFQRTAVTAAHCML